MWYGCEMTDSPRPIRLRLSRRLGFNLQAESLAANGLPAVNIARPSRWGNAIARRQGVHPGEAAVAAFHSWLENEAPQRWKNKARSVLKGKNLGCWCALDAPCHADILLAFVNSQD